jgi:hypothetical protein
VNTTRKSVDDLRRSVRNAYASGRQIGLSHEESVQRAMALVPGLALATVKEWVEAVRS